MARNTQWVRDRWSPACKAHSVSTKDAYTALDRCFKKHNYRPRSGQTWGYNCRRITGGSGYSLHAYDPGERFTFWSLVTVTMAVAVDINSLANPYGKRLVTDMPRAMINDILAICTVDGLQVWRWGGYYSGNKDAMHFELIVSPAELARGIDWSTVPSGGAGGGFLADAKVTQEQWDDLVKSVNDLRQDVANILTYLGSKDSKAVGAAVGRGRVLSDVDFKVREADKLGFSHATGADVPTVTTPADPSPDTSGPSTPPGG